MVDRPYDSALATRETRFSPPVDSLVSFYLDEQLIAPPNQNRKAVNSRDLHWFDPTIRAAGGATVRRGLKVLNWLVTLGTDDPCGRTSLQLVGGRT